MVELIKASIQDNKVLQAVCKQTYAKVFSNHWTSNGLVIYLEQQFGDQRLKDDLKNPDYDYFFIHKEGQHIGFLKIKYKTSTDFSEIDNCELEKIYILPAYSGQGIGKWAMKQIITQVKNKGKKILFLCVLDTNEHAIAFYKKLDFQFHSTTRLDAPFFREELRGMDRMYLILDT